MVTWPCFCTVEILVALVKPPERIKPIHANHNTTTAHSVLSFRRPEGGRISGTCMQRFLPPVEMTNAVVVIILYDLPSIGSRADICSKWRRLQGAVVLGKARQRGTGSLSCVRTNVSLRHLSATCQSQRSGPMPAHEKEMLQPLVALEKRWFQRTALLDCSGSMHARPRRRHCPHCGQSAQAMCRRASRRRRVRAHKRSANRSLTPSTALGLHQPERRIFLDSPVAA